MKKGTIIVPKNDAAMIKSKHWLISRNINYRMVYIPTNGRHDPLIIADMDFVDKMLYRLTFANLSTERVQVFG